ncbi:MAG: phytanoyl-CoA dioxygenase family protein, partial [Lentisphaeria bacterium]|nr:phytanoyl-CoA dioxygenase family protein [Lentisphaeria bacterium]
MAILTAEQIDVYNQNGFLHVKRFIGPAVVERIRKEIEGIHERMASTPASERPNAHVTWEDLPEGEPKMIRQLMGSQHVSATISSIISSGTMIGAMVDLLGDEVEL